MRCTHAEKLIPLYAGDDLPAREAATLRRHLESCANCRRLAAEFEESRDWLRGFAAPQFDDALLDGMRDSVLRDIGRVENQSRWLHWVVPRLNLQFATSMAVLFLISLLAAYAYRGKHPRKDPDRAKVAKENRGGAPKGGLQRNDEGPKVAPSPVPTQHPIQKHIRRIIKQPSIRLIQPPDIAIAQALLHSPPIRFEPIVELPLSGAGPKTNAVFDREMTRIEFQTADPNIRIIWLTPKDPDSSSTKPNTNTR